MPYPYPAEISSKACVRSPSLLNIRYFRSRRSRRPYEATLSRPVRFHDRYKLNTQVGACYSEPLLFAYRYVFQSGWQQWCGSVWVIIRIRCPGSGNCPYESGSRTRIQGKIIISIFCHGMFLHIYHTGTGTCPRSGLDFYNTNPDPRIRIRITVFSFFGFHCDWFCPDPLVLISVMCLVGIFVLVGVCCWLALLQTVNMLTG